MGSSPGQTKRRSGRGERGAEKEGGKVRGTKLAEQRNRTTPKTRKGAAKARRAQPRRSRTQHHQEGPEKRTRGANKINKAERAGAKTKAARGRPEPHRGQRKAHEAAEVALTPPGEPKRKGEPQRSHEGPKENEQATPSRPKLRTGGSSEEPERALQAGNRKAETS